MPLQFNQAHPRSMLASCNSNPRRAARSPWHSSSHFHNTRTYTYVRGNPLAPKVQFLGMPACTHARTHASARDVTEYRCLPHLFCASLTKVGGFEPRRQQERWCAKTENEAGCMKPAAAPNGEVFFPPSFRNLHRTRVSPGFRMKNTSSHQNRALALRQLGRLSLESNFPPGIYTRGEESQITKGERAALE